MENVKEKKWRKNQKIGDKKFLEFYYMGYNDSEIGRKLKCSPITVRHRRVKFGLVANAKPLGTSQKVKTSEELKEEYRIAVRKGNKVYYPSWMKRTSNQRFSKENKQLKNEVKMWKETCEIIADRELLSNINKSLISLKEKGGIPLTQL